MRRQIAILAAVCTLAVLASAQAVIAYFTNSREVKIADPGRTNYFVVDQEIWQHTRTDLADLRLFSGQTEIPYALLTERAQKQTTEQEARMFNLGRVGERTQFIVDTGAPEYNQIGLKLSSQARDFIAKVRLWGADEFSGSAKWTDLGTHTIYDFSHEKLGSSRNISLPDSRFKFLRVSIDGLTPENIKGITVATTLNHEAQWTELKGTIQIQNSGRQTIVTIDVGDKTPVEKIALTVPKTEKNFYRTVNVSCLDADNHESYVANDAISRVHLTRERNTVDSEDLAITLPTVHATRFKLTVENGDDPPLKIEKITAMQVQRRVYFDPKGAADLTLYYGDSKLSAPVYDYAKLFHEQRDAAQAKLGPGMHNAAHTGRPDERPWTERHGWVLWAALIAAVLGIGAVALKSFKRA